MTSKLDGTSGIATPVKIVVTMPLLDYAGPVGGSKLMNLFRQQRRYFKEKFKELQLAKYVEVLGEIAAQEELLSYYKRQLKAVDQEVHFWEYARLKQAIQDTSEHAQVLNKRAHAIRPEDWYGKE